MRGTSDAMTTAFQRTVLSTQSCAIFVGFQTFDSILILVVCNDYSLILDEEIQSACLGDILLVVWVGGGYSVTVDQTFF